ncbi:MAG: hypothetical protein ACRYF0_20580 [Janthinobacterium lividum]
MAARDIVTVMNLQRPAYLGYSTALDALVFAYHPWVPASDVGKRATLLLDRQGQVKKLSAGGPIMWQDAIDCDPQLVPAGPSVLTCTELLRDGHPPRRLTKPHAQLHAARFLHDSTLLTVYENGDYQPASSAADGPSDATVTAPLVSYDFVATPAQRRLPTAFVTRTSGRVLLLYEENTKFVLVPKAVPERLAELPLKTLIKFRPPLRPYEKRYAITTDFSHLELYVDTLRPQQVRYLLHRAE